MEYGDFKPVEIPVGDLRSRKLHPLGGSSSLGTQFHPEKSGTIGLKILQNFVKNVR